MISRALAGSFRGQRGRWRPGMRERFVVVGKPGGAPMTDWSAAVIAIASARDRAQFAALFAHFAPRLKGFYMRLGTPSELAEDMAQDTMLAVWRKAESFDPSRASASTWIFTIARNIRIDRKRRERDPKAFHELTDGAPEPTPVDQLLGVEREARVRRALSVLPSDQADVIRLAFFDDRPQSDIAKVLGIPLGTVKSRVRLAMSKLRALVEDPQ